MTQQQQTDLGNNVHLQAPHAPASIYQARCDHFATQRDTYNRRSYRHANLSLTLIIAALLIVTYIPALSLWLPRVFGLR